MHQRNILMDMHKTIIAVVVVILMPAVALASGGQMIDWNSLLDVGVKCSKGLPKELLLAVIWVESRGNPNAVNINGVGGFLPKTKVEAENIIYRYNNANVDIGLMQVNWLSWGRVYRLLPSDLLDPVVNICVGAAILRHYLDQNNWTWKGIGRYNAISYHKQIRYAVKVYENYKKIKSWAN